MERHERQTRLLVASFGVDMLLKLNANNHKAHWASCSNDFLLTRLVEETLELKAELTKGDLEKAIREAADVANFAAMIADNCKIALQEKANKE